MGRRRIETPDERIAWFVLVATIPAGLAGLLGEDLIARHLGDPWQIAVLLTVGAMVLYWADSSPQTREMGDLGLRQAIVMGFAQALALAPGVSRSGITIICGTLHAPRSRQRRTVLVSPAHPDRPRRRLRSRE